MDLIRSNMPFTTSEISQSSSSEEEEFETMNDYIEPALEHFTQTIPEEYRQRVIEAVAI